jgi:hypothetical protein
MNEPSEEQRRDEILKRMLKTPPKKQKQGREPGKPSPRPSSVDQDNDKRRKP